MQHDKKAIQEIADKVQDEYQMGGLSDGLYLDFATDVAMRYADSIKKMTAMEFYEKSIHVAKNAGFENKSISVGVLIADGRTNYYIKLWTGKKHIDSGLHNNPQAALQAFEDELIKSLKVYDNTQQDITL